MTLSPTQRFLLIVLLLVPSDCRAHSSQSIHASKDEDVLLPCVVSPEGDTRLRWKFSNDPGKDKVILSRPPNTQDSDRAQWHYDEEGQLSLRLTNLDKSDEGLYSCEVCRAWDCSLVTNISLRIRECSFLPALKVKSGTDLILNCTVGTKSEDRPLNVSWSVLKGGTPTAVRSEGASLTLRSVTTGDNAWYRCSYDHVKTRLCFDIKVLVQDPDEVVTTFFTPYETEAEHQTQGGTTVTTITIVVIVLVLTLAVAALTGLIIYYTHNRRVTQLRQVQQADPSTLKDHIYCEPTFCTPSQCELCLLLLVVCCMTALTASSLLQLLYGFVFDR